MPAYFASFPTVYRHLQLVEWIVFGAVIGLIYRPAGH